jgi:hypothetical protein
MYKGFLKGRVICPLLGIVGRKIKKREILE